MKTTIIVLLCLALSSFAQAENKTAKGLVESGFAKYEEKGPMDAMKTWLKGSGFEGNNEAMSQHKTLEQLESLFGQYESYEIVKEIKMSKRNSLIFAVIHYGKGASFIRFQLYKTADETWVATEFKFHTEAAQIWPHSLVYGR